ncbi:MAG: hypothetical protein ACLP7Q_10295 [Isosphaeraceae bacterium]
MTASSLIDSLAGRGLVLSIEGTRIQASPKRLLNDQDRHLIRQFRDDLFVLLTERETSQPREEEERTPWEQTPSPLFYQRPEEIGRWPISDRQRWGELANQFEDKGLKSQEAQQRAYEVVRSEREATGEIYVCVEEHPAPDPFPEWHELIDPRDLAPKPPPPRPLGQPTYGLTKAIRVVKLATWTRAQQRDDPVVKVTAEGWDQWYPVATSDLPCIEKDVEGQKVGDSSAGK